MHGLPNKRKMANASFAPEHAVRIAGKLTPTNPKSEHFWFCGKAIAEPLLSACAV
jgi:hypothetical protein